MRCYGRGGLSGAWVRRAEPCQLMGPLLAQGRLYVVHLCVHARERVQPVQG